MQLIYVYENEIPEIWKGIGQNDAVKINFLRAEEFKSQFTSLELALPIVFLHDKKKKKLITFMRTSEINRKIVEHPSSDSLQTYILMKLERIQNLNEK